MDEQAPTQPVEITQAPDCTTEIVTTTYVPSLALVALLLVAAFIAGRKTSKVVSW